MTVPKGIKKPSDHKPPTVSEPNIDEPAVINFAGHTFVIPRDAMDWPTDVVRAFEEGKTVIAVRELVDPAAYDRIGMGRWPMRRTAELAELIAEAVGFESTKN